MAEHILLHAGLGLLVIVLTMWKMRAEWAEAADQKMDAVGSVLYAFTLLAVMYGFRLLPGLAGLALMVAGAMCLAAFVLRESRAANPVLDIGLFRHNLVFALSNLSALINYAATFALIFLLSLYLQYIKGLDPRTAGLVLLSQPIVMAVFSPLAGRLSDRVEPRVVASIGMAISAAGLLLTSFLDAGSTDGAHRRPPDDLRPGIRAFLLAEHERHHGLRGAPALRGCLRHHRGDAADRADAEHGDLRHDHRAVRGKGADHPPSPRGVPGRLPRRVSPLLSPLRWRASSRPWPGAGYANRGIPDIGAAAGR